MRNGLLRSWQPGGAHYKRFREGKADADTMRKRTLWDRKGKTFTLSFTLRHSPRRTDSYDVLEGGRVVFTGGRTTLGRFMAKGLP